MRVRRIAPAAYERRAKPLVADCLGTTYADAVESLDRPDPVLLVAEAAEETVGFACGYPTPDPEAYVDWFDGDTGAASLNEKLVVAEAWRGAGVGTRLTEARLRALPQPTLVEAWLRTGGPDTTSLLERVGFERVAVRERRWYEESRAADDPTFCPDCGRVCECAAAVYVFDRS